MSTVSKALYELREMDELAAMDSPIHKLHPLAKLLAALIFIFSTASFDKYDLSGLVPMLLIPLFLFSLSGVSVRSCFYKLRLMLILVCAVGLANPIFERAPMLYIGSLAVSGGTVSMLTLMLKGVLCLMTAFLLAATTSIDSLCAALKKLRVPALVVSLILLTYRYIALMVEEVAVMSEAYHLRAPKQKGIHFSAWGSFVGQLLLRSSDRATELYQSMQLRGYNGDFSYADVPPFTGRDLLYTALVLFACLLLRTTPIAELIGGMVI